MPIALITRGNGKEGINVLHKFADRFKPVNSKGLVCIRGEAYTPKSLFNELKERGVACERNFANGVLSRDSDITDPDLKYVSFVFYQLRIYTPNDWRTSESISKLDKNESIRIIHEDFNLPVVKMIQVNKNTKLDPESLKEYYRLFQK